ncbi:MAG: FecR domain-containing protein [Planctomycetes bacterium]|nr:FecR domain-containing protein [Planctomycetota bacterium]
MASHPPLETLAAWCDGTLAGPAREAAETHLAGCAACRRLTGGEENGAVEIPPALLAHAREAVRRMPARRARRGVSALAAGLAACLTVAAGLAILPAVTGGERGVRGTLTLGGRTRAFQAMEPLRFPTAGVLSFPEGVRAEIAPRGEARLLPPRDGERLRLRLDAGEASLRVHPGKGAVVIESPCGDVRVLGTDFSVRLWRDPLGDREEPDMLEVEVRSGKVVVETGGNAATVRSGGRAYAVRGAAPRGTDPVPPSPFWADRIARTLDLSTSPGQRLIALAELAHQGDTGRAVAAGRVLDRARPVAERARWARLFAAAFPGNEGEIPW